jgi:glycosyltransferase involved in cell wall biosynthesis
MSNISICIPTYNRAINLNNCLKSLVAATKCMDMDDYEICISDNGSIDGTCQVVKKYEEKLKIKYKKQINNRGMANNILDVVDMASGEFVWIVGDDDLVMPYALEEMLQIIINNPQIDFIYANSLILDKSEVDLFFETKDHDFIIKSGKLFSKYSNTGGLKFKDLINHEISFDYLGGIFLSIFRRGLWVNNKHVIQKKKLADERLFSNLDNTFPHAKIFAHAFISSNAYFVSRPMSCNLSGIREWSLLWPLIKSVRLIELLDLYKTNGIGYFQYMVSKNKSLNTFFPDLILIMLGGKSRGRDTLSSRVISTAFYFPGSYWSIIRPFIRKNFYKKIAEYYYKKYF